jgi:predicted secreted Zn-dependent protease
LLIALTLLPILGLLLSSPAGSAPPPLGKSVVEAASKSRDRFYEVRGSSADAVFASIGRQKLGNTPGRSASGLTESKLSYSLESIYGGNKPCRIISLQLHLDIQVTLPRHASPGTLDSDTRRNWEIYATAVEAHEYRHVELELRGLEELSERLSRAITAGKITAPGKSSCANYVDELLRQQRSLTRSRNEDFHIEAAQEVRDLQAMAQKRLEVFDAELARDDRTLIEFDALIRNVRIQYENLLEAIPLTSSRQRAESRLVARGLGEELNAAIEQRNLLLEELRMQRRERGRLVEDLLWIR